MTQSKTLLRTAVIGACALLLASCAMTGSNQPIRGTTPGGMHGPENPMHMMMRDLGCPHEQMDMAAMRTMTPDRHRAMMSKHVADCRAKISAEGASLAHEHVKACVAAALTKQPKKIPRDLVTTIVHDCTAAMTEMPDAKTPTEHQHGA